MLGTEKVRVRVCVCECVWGGGGCSSYQLNSVGEFGKGRGSSPFAPSSTATTLLLLHVFQLDSVICLHL